MKSDWYFECEPWDHAAELAGDFKFGGVAAVSINCVCQKGKIEASVKKWEIRLSKLLGEIAGRDIVRTKNALSVIGRYEKNAIVRIFIDDTGSENYENFEILCRDALLVWKPDVHVLSVLKGEEYFQIDCSNTYPTDLING